MCVCLHVLMVLISSYESCVVAFVHLVRSQSPSRVLVCLMRVGMCWWSLLRTLQSLSRCVCARTCCLWCVCVSVGVCVCVCVCAYSAYLPLSLLLPCSLLCLIPSPQMYVSLATPLHIIKHIMQRYIILSYSTCFVELLQHEEFCQ